MTKAIHHRTRIFVLMLSSVAAVAVPAPVTARAAEAPIKEVLSNHVGWEVDGTTSGKICTVESKDKCRSAAPSGEPGGFNSAKGVAVDNASELVSPEHGDVYVADENNNRVQVLTPSGEFVLMFGGDVNKTKVKEGAPQAERDICTKASGNVCQAGVEGGADGQFAEPQSVVVDSNTGNVYVRDLRNWRVQEFTAVGEFVLMLGREVNETKDKEAGSTALEKNLCTAISKDKCKAGTQSPQESAEPGAFDFAQKYGGSLAMGGSKDVLYVGDSNRVQEFEADGTYIGEIDLTLISPAPSSLVTGLAVDQTTDNVYVVYSVNFTTNIIRAFDPKGKELEHFEIIPRKTNGFELAIGAIAFDPAGRLAVTEQENLLTNGQNESAFRGALYDVGSTSLHLITEFTTEFGSTVSSSIAFNVNSELYAAGEHEVDTYLPLPVAELSTSPATCVAGPEHGVDATLDCSLNGEVNVWKVPETEEFFEWGLTTALGKTTPRQSVEEEEPGKAVKVSAPMESPLPPNTTFYYQMAGYDRNVKSPENALTSEIASFKVPAVPPRIVGEPSVLFTGSFSAVMFGEVNPENTGTEYFVEYGPCPKVAGCDGRSRTKALRSMGYGTIGVTLEATGLRADTQYSYRFFAANEVGEAAVNETGGPDVPEGTFVTGPAPIPQAGTGGASAIGTTSAVVSGTVNPDGQAATYTFQLGRYEGARTQYVVVFSGSAGTGTVPVTETLGLSGLQPGTEYAYKIAIKSGYGTAQGEPVVFTTAGLPTVLPVPSSPATLPVPPIAFPKEIVSKPTTKCKRGFARGKNGKCIKVKKKSKSRRGTPKRGKR